METTLNIRLPKELRAKVEKHAKAIKSNKSYAARLALEWFYSSIGPGGKK
jgi:predicted transcriptional regulator